MGCKNLDIAQNYQPFLYRVGKNPNSKKIRVEHCLNTQNFCVNYYPGGMLMPGRSFNLGSYRYGHNGQESDAEIAGGWGSHYTAEFWMYDSRLMRRWENDLIAYPWQSPYACFNNNPIFFADPLGLEGEDKVTKVGEAKPSGTGTASDPIYTQGNITNQTFELGEFEVCGNCSSGGGGTASLPSDNTSVSIPHQSTLSLGDFKETSKITGLNDLTRYGSDKAFASTILDSKIMTQEAKSYYFNMRVTQGPARQVGEQIAGIIVGAASFGATEALIGGLSRTLGTAYADALGIGSTYRHWGTAELQFTLGTNAYKYSPFKVPQGYTYTTPMLTNSSTVVYNRLALNYTTIMGRNPMMSSYYINQIEIRGFYLSGVVGRQGTTLGGGIQYTPLNEVFRKGLAGVTH